MQSTAFLVFLVLCALLVGEPRTEVGRDLLHLHARGALEVAELVADGDGDALEGGGCVLVLDTAREGRVELPFALAEERIVHRHWELVGYRRPNEDRSLVRPATGDVLDRVSAPAEDEEGDVELAHKVDTFAMCGDGQIERAETVAPERISTTLEDDGCRPECGDGVVDHGLEDREVHVVVDTVFERDIQAEVLPGTGAVVIELSCPWEEFASILMKRDGHDPVGMIERKLDAVSMVDVDVDIENTGMIPCNVDEWIGIAFYFD